MNNEEFNILSNIADILQSDWKLGVALLLSQNIDLDLFVYNLLDNYNNFKIVNVFGYRYNNNSYIMYSSSYGVSIDIDDIDRSIKNELQLLINMYKRDE